MAESFDLSLVIPVWNEAAKIEQDVRAAFAFFREHNMAGQVIVSDDGSQDQTAGIVRRLQTEFGPSLQALFPGKHLGKGHAVRQGLLAGKGRLIGFMDSGSTVPLHFLITAQQLIQEGVCHIAAGSRFLRYSHILKPMPLRRRIISFLFRTLVHGYLPLPAKLSDPQCGFKIFEGKTAHWLANHSQIDGFVFDLELYLLAKKAGFVWKEFPIDWRCDRDSRMSAVRNLVPVMRDLHRLRKRFSKEA